jgi:large subunit ribosomal protein L9
MKMILTQDVAQLGPIGHIVNVKDGYARNYLIPRSLAVVANESNEKELAHKKRVLAKKRDRLLAEVKKKCSDLEKLSLTVSKQVGEDERIFGTVTTTEIALLIEKEGLEVSKKDISFQEEIKKVGVYTALVRLHSEVTAKIKVWVVAQQ